MKSYQIIKSDLGFIATCPMCEQSVVPYRGKGGGLAYNSVNRYHLMDEKGEKSVVVCCELCIRGKVPNLQENVKYSMPSVEPLVEFKQRG